MAEIDQLNEDQERAQLQARLIEFSFEPILVWAFDAGVIEWNHGCERLYGFTRAEAVGCLIDELLQTVHPLPVKEFRALLAADREWTGELRHRAKDGREVIVESRQQLTEIGGRRFVLETSRDVTEIKRIELNAQFINRLDLALSPITDVDELVRLATSKLGEYLGVDRCHLNEIYLTAGSAVVREKWEGWLRGMPSLAGEYRIDDFVQPDFRAELEAGHTAVVNDVRFDPRTLDYLSNYESFGVRSFVSVPVLNEKQWEASLMTSQSKARQWRSDEVQLMRDTGTRIWLGVKQARTLAALRESEERARRTLAEQMVAGVAECDSAGKFILVNQRYCDITGYSKDELLKMRIDEITDPADWEANAELYSRLFKIGESFFIENRYRRKDDSEIWVNTHVSPIRNIQGKVKEAVSVVIDITRRKRAEWELASARDRLAADLDAMTRLQRIGAIFVREGELPAVFGEIVEAAIAITGTDKGDIQLFEPESGKLNIVAHRGFQQSFLDFWNAEEAEGVCGISLRLGQRVIVENVTLSPIFIGTPAMKALLKSGVWAVQSTPVISRSGRLLAVFSTHFAFPHRPDERALRLLDLLALQTADIIERAQAEAALRAAFEQAETATRAKDEFLAVVSHELRSPLTSILGYARLVRAETTHEARICQMAEIIERNGKMQLQLIEDLLDTARIISGKLKLEVQPVDLVTVISAALDVVGPAAQAKGIQLESDLDPFAGQVTGDPNRLQQVVWNLLSNAIKFTPSGGRVEITLKREDPHVQIVVGDNGKGIDPEFLPHIFERFRQRDMSSGRRAGGLGLGLALVKHLVELHGGTVEAESSGKGKGAFFAIRLPLRAVYTSPAAEQKPASTMLGSGAKSLAGLRALIVDDEEEVRFLLAMTLESFGAMVQAAASGTEMLETLARQTAAQHFDVLICDIGMPGEDGYQVIRKVRALAPDKGGAIPAIALTAYGRAEDRVRALTAGFQMHIAKPVDPDELAVVILSLVKRFDASPAL
jgi:PAS domain S-box-containing protein